MTLLSLPTELLTEICRRVSSSSDLYHLVQTSKQLVGIVKPILYHHVIITDKVQRDLLGNVSEEDAKLVKKLVIRGFESVDLVREGEDDYYWERKDNIGPGCIRDLLEGKLLDLSSLETLHVKNVEEEESEMGQHSNDLSVKVASNLVELSVLAHNGAGNLWHYVLRPEIVPNLRRLGFCDVIRYEYGYDGYDSDSDSSAEASLCDRQVTIPSTAPFSQLEALVVSHSVSLTEIPNFPFSNSLVRLNFTAISDTPLSLQCYQNVGFTSQWTHCLNDSRNRSLPLPSLRFLSLRPLYRDTLTEQAQVWLDKIEADGVEVRWDKEDEWSSTSTVPQHFVDYLREKETTAAAGGGE